MAEREGEGTFDAFDPDTWRFEPAPAPWHRRRTAVAAGVAVVAASAAIVVSGVLLLVDGSGSVTEEPATTSAPTAASTAASTPAQSSVAPPASSPSPAPPPPSPPPAPPSSPPPAEVTAEPIVTAPALEEPPSTRATKEPEFGVTRTKETRRPISVAPNRP